MHAVTDHLVRAYADTRLREAAHQRLVLEARRATRRPPTPGRVRLLVGRGLQHVGTRLVGAPPSHVPRSA